MRMLPLAHSLAVLGLATVSLGLVGCSPSYFTELMSFSTVRADVATPGKLSWTQTVDEVSGEVTKADATYFNPSITLTLDANSAPVTYTAAQADFFYTEGAVNDANKVVTNPISDIPTQNFPFTAQLKNPDRAAGATTQTVILNGLIPQKLVDITNPKSAGSQHLYAAIATVTLTGTNGFGAKVTTKVNVPINIDYK